MRPKKVKIGPHKYRIGYGPLKGEGADQIGVCHTHRAEIHIKEGLARTIEQESLLHEILHAIWSAQGLDNSDNKDGLVKEEQAVAALAPGILAVLKNNLELVKYLLED